MRLAPLILLGLVTFNELYWQMALNHPFEPWMEHGFQVSDVLMCAALLGYVAGQYRLQAIGRSVFPSDEPLKQSRRQGPVDIKRRRTALLVTREELAILAASLPLWALAAQLLWPWLARPRELLEWDWRIVRGIVCLVIFVSILTVAAGFLHHWRCRRMTAEEATLLLYDTFWKETRGDQRWYARWLAKLRQSQKEQP
jgi:hypothetical protein